jgi:hypothetical protein
MEEWDWISRRKSLENLYFTHIISPSETFPCMKLKTQKLALIREKRAVFFPDNPQAGPVLLSGPESELKMAANSTY